MDLSCKVPYDVRGAEVQVALDPSPSELAAIHNEPQRRFDQVQKFELNT